MAAQRVDGSLARHDPNAGSLYVTALAIQALQPSRLQFDITAPLTTAPGYDAASGTGTVVAEQTVYFARPWGKPAFWQSPQYLCPCRSPMRDR